MAKKLSLSNLQSIFNESIERAEPTLAFEIVNGSGRFLFLMFFDSEDDSTKDELFIYMRTINRMVRLKMYGNHRSGQFDVYINSYVENWFKQELQLGDQDPENPFVFDQFFENLNQSIPHELSLDEKIETLRDSWREVSNDLPNEIIDENEKVYLIGPRSLPKEKKPRERTLRKLYVFVDANPNDVTRLIGHLKRLNKTVAWTNDPKKGTASVLSILNNLK